jgi:hypothetical protein
MSTVRLGVIMLVHEHLDRAAALANHWVAQGCPVAVHADRRVPADAMVRFNQATEAAGDVLLTPRRACEWGTFSLVAATNDAAAALLSAYPDVTHVVLCSGSCVPLRPADDLTRFLAEQPDADFIQSVACEDVDWAIGGLNGERFTLRFPFAWKRRRRLFDKYVELQRRVGFSRSIPEEVEPHLGSQWWCLTRATLAAILSAPERPRLDRYFRRVWIPDESYYQSLARRHSRLLISRSLTFSRFDPQGRPFVLYDDHLPALQARPEFLVRKVWHGANAVYDAVLGDGSARRADRPSPPAQTASIDGQFDAAEQRGRTGRPGLVAQHRFPRPGFERGRTRAPYTILVGYDAAFTGVRDWLETATGADVHGRLFHPQKAQFAQEPPVGPGCSSAEPRLRDYDPKAFLTNFVWAGGGRHQVFLFEPGDSGAFWGLAAFDPNATIVMITGAWILPLLNADIPFDRLRKTAAYRQRAESDLLRLLGDPWSQAARGLQCLSLRQFLDQPACAEDAALAALAAPINPQPAHRPVPRPHDGLDTLIDRLRNSGIEVPSASRASQRVDGLVAGAALEARA